MSDISCESRKEIWVDPAIRTLDVAETQQRNHRGGDGGKYGPDCSRS